MCNMVTGHQTLTNQFHPSTIAVRSYPLLMVVYVVWGRGVVIPQKNVPSMLTQGAACQPSWYESHEGVG